VFAELSVRATAHHKCVKMYGVADDFVSSARLLRSAVATKSFKISSRQIVYMEYGNLHKKRSFVRMYQSIFANNAHFTVVRWTQDPDICTNRTIWGSLADHGYDTEGTSYHTIDVSRPCTSTSTSLSSQSSSQ
jgi:hypothetical protein